MEHTIEGIVHVKPVNACRVSRPTGVLCSLCFVCWVCVALRHSFRAGALVDSQRPGDGTALPLLVELSLVLALRVRKTKFLASKSGMGIEVLVSTSSTLQQPSVQVVKGSKFVVGQPCYYQRSLGYSLCWHLDRASRAIGCPY